MQTFRTTQGVNQSSSPAETPSRGRAHMILDSSVSHDDSQLLIHCVCHPTIHTLYNMAIGVERDRYACVAEELLDELGVLACNEEY